MVEVYSDSEVLELFHTGVAEWFRDEVGPPSPVQLRAWPEIAKGNHVLLSAPTGSGKTLAAFLWAVDRLVRGEWSVGKTRVLYVSPMKALNNDVRRNLTAPLERLEERFSARGLEFPSIKVQTRSGDTPQSERQRMIRRPPEILITTPESLNLLLSSSRARDTLRDLETVILDEIHAVAGTKRGVHLMTAVERLALLSGEFQRVALSATVRPMDAVAAFVGGQMPNSEGIYTARDMTLVEDPAAKEYDVHVRFPADARESVEDGTWWPSLITAFKEAIARNRSTLFFTNGRRLCERLTLMINEHEDKTLAYAHHGSLSREVREVVEQRLKNGELKAIVATNSLELGIDIGALDEVVMVQTPPSAASALQRLGRAGHTVGKVSRGAIYPTHGRDFLDAAVMTTIIRERDIEEVKPVENALDVLAQVLVSMTAVDEWPEEDLYRFIRSCSVYRTLSRRQFDLVLEMLEGRYADSKVRGLKPRISRSRIDHTITAAPGALPLVYTSGGTIPDRGYFRVRLKDAGTILGELDEEFVWERSLGHTIALGTQLWRIQDITDDEVIVKPWEGRVSEVPFWKADESDRPSHVSLRIAEFLESVDARVGDAEFVPWLVDTCAMEKPAAEELRRFLRRQQEVTKAPLPHRHHVVVEHLAGPSKKTDTKQVIIHTMWGGAVNRPLALALSAWWEREHGYALEVHSNNDGIGLLLPHDFRATDLLSTVKPAEVTKLLRLKLEQTGYFGARFRENAARALILPRDRFGKRTPLWLNRLRSRKLLSAVKRYEDFPILLETWRTCLKDNFELDTLTTLLNELRDGAIAVSEVHPSAPSPFTASLVWQHTNKYMYKDDTPEAAGASNLRSDLLEEAVHSPHLRPALDPEIVETFRRKLQRVYPGYAPATGRDLLNWLTERLFVPDDEWVELLRAIRDDGHDVEAFVTEVLEKIVRIEDVTGAVRGYCARETAPRFLDAFPETAGRWSFKCLAPLPPPPERDLFQNHNIEALESFVDQWLQYYGPIPVLDCTTLLPFDSDAFVHVLDHLAEAETVVVDRLTANAEELEVCDTENLERLLRIQRASRRATMRARPVDHLQYFLARHQGVLHRARGADGLRRALDHLYGYVLPVELWEREVLPSRIEDYSAGLLDSVAEEDELVWVGSGERKACVCPRALLDLLPLPTEVAWHHIPDIFTELVARYSFGDLLEKSDLDSGELTTLLWSKVWKGTISNDSFQAFRKGIETKFQIARDEHRGKSRSGFRRWRATRPFAGNWFAIRWPDPPDNALDMDELNRDRARLLLQRYGVVTRELLWRESKAFRWADLFRSFRLMELAGEAVTGHFFEDLSGPQFTTPQFLAELERVEPENEVYWLNAMDPASLCGVDVPEIKRALPPRRAGNHMVFSGTAPAMTSMNNGKTLEILVRPDDDRLPEFLQVLSHILKNPVRQTGSIRIEKINGVSPKTSPYRPVLESTFECTSEPKGLTLWASR